MRSIRRVLVVQPYGIGDALFVTPLLRALRTLPSVETVDLLLGSRTESVFRNNPHVDKIFSIDKEKWHGSRTAMVRDLILLWKNLRGRYDLLIDFSMQREYGFYGAVFLRIPRRIGINFKNRGIFLTQSVDLKEGYESKHAINFYCEVGKLIGLEIEERFLEFYLSEDNRDAAQKVLNEKSISAASRFVAVAPGGGESWGKDAFFKRWPAAHFSEMLSLLKQRIDFEGILIIGSPGERELGEEIKGVCSIPAFNLCGELSLEVSGALLEKVALFIANDGGLVHLAHALRVPSIAFYGPVDPEIYGPHPPTAEAISITRKGLPCRPCYSGFRYNSSCVDRECLTALRPQEIFEFLEKMNFFSAICNKDKQKV